MDALERAYIINQVAESEAMLVDSDSSSSSGGYEPHSDNMPSSHSGSSSDPSGDEQQPSMSQHILDSMAELYSSHYLNERHDIPKTHDNLHHLLHTYKNDFPDIFRSYMRMSPACFDAILDAISADPVFHNNSPSAPQLPIIQQLAITLYRFGHFGNAASALKVALWASVGYSMVDLVTKRVMTAICHKEFRRATVYWPNDAEKEAARAWVEEHSCPAWRNGWMMVDGTLVPLFARPGFFGNTWFDRKSNYSLNVQVRISILVEMCYVHNNLLAYLHAKSHDYQLRGWAAR